MPVRVAFFPSFERSSNPYWAILRKSLESTGVEFATTDERSFRTRWLWENRREVHVLHFHFVQQFYSFETTRARLRWVLRFGRNLIFARLLGYRTVFTLHNLKPTYPLAPGWVDYAGQWAASNLVNAVIVHCGYARDALAGCYGRRNGVFVVPHPHFIETYPNAISRDDARRELGFEDGHTVFAYVGGIRPNKGIQHLINAFRSVPGSNLRLLIAGEPQHPSDYLQSIAELAAPDPRIKIVPAFIRDEDLQLYLNAADVVVLPFSSILTSSSTILAMSFGKPVVVPAMGCLIELVGPDEGIAYDPREPRALPDAIRRCSKVDLPKMGDAARAKVATFTPGKFAQGTLEAYTCRRS